MRNVRSPTPARHADSDPVSWADLRKVVRAIRKVDQRVSECFEAVTAGDDAQAEFWNEHQDKIERLRRSVNRLTKRVESLEYANQMEDTDGLV